MDCKLAKFSIEHWSKKEGEKGWEEPGHDKLRGGGEMEVKELGLGKMCLILGKPWAQL